MNKQLDELRQRLNKLDQELLDILVKRFEVTRQVGRYKSEHNMPAVDKSREEFIFNRIAEQAAAKGLNPDLAIRIMRSIIDAVVVEHKKIAKQK